MNTQNAQLVQSCQFSDFVVLNAWTVQRLVMELIINHFLHNDPAKLGYAFEQRYSPDKTQSSIYIDVAFTWKPDQTNKRPAIIVSRGEQTFKPQTFDAKYAEYSIDSTKIHGILTSMPIIINCIATNLGLTEMLADYVKQGILYYQPYIRQDFGFYLFRFTRVGAPQFYLESKEHFNVPLIIETQFHESWKIVKDDLKLKTIFLKVFEELSKEQK